MFLKWYEVEERIYNLKGETTKLFVRHAADIQDVGVRFVAWTIASGFVEHTHAEVYVGAPGAAEQGELVAAMHSTGDLDSAKADCLRTFKTWADTVVMIASTDGHGNWDPIFKDVE